MGKWDFGKKTEEELNAKKNDRIAEHEAAIEKAKVLLHSEPFKDFLESYREAERKTVESLIKLNRDEFDNEQLGKKARHLIGQITNLRALVETVHLKAGEKYASNG